MILAKGFPILERSSFCSQSPQCLKTTMCPNKFWTEIKQNLTSLLSIWRIILTPKLAWIPCTYPLVWILTMGNNVRRSFAGLMLRMKPVDPYSVLTMIRRRPMFYESWDKVGKFIFVRPQKWRPRSWRPRSWRPLVGMFIFEWPQKWRPRPWRPPVGKFVFVRPQKWRREVSFLTDFQPKWKKSCQMTMSDLLVKAISRKTSSNCSTPK